MRYVSQTVLPHRLGGGGLRGYPAQPGPAPRPAPAPPVRDGGRTVALVVFGWLLAASAAIWWFAAPAIDLRATATVLTEAGRLTGMLGGYLLLVQVLLMSRVAWLEDWIASRDLLHWHRWLGPSVLALLVGHAVLLVYGSALAAEQPAASTAWGMIRAGGTLLEAFIATAIIVLVSLTSVRAIRRRMPYERWKLVHRSTYAATYLAYGHQFTMGRDLTAAGPARWFWGSLYAFVLVCLIWGRVLEPLWFHLRHRMRVHQVVKESEDLFSIYVTGRRLDLRTIAAGQHMRWRFLTAGQWTQSHPFSLSAAPNGRWLRLTVKAVGDHTGQLRWLRPGTRVLAQGPYGDFTPDRRRAGSALLIAVGSGIAPIRALAGVMPAGTTLIYRARAAEDLAFVDELDRLHERRSLTVHYVLGRRTEPGPQRLLSPEGLRQLVPDVVGRDVYLCGPPTLINPLIRTLRRLRVPRRQIHLDPFEY